MKITPWPDWLIDLWWIMSEWLTSSRGKYEEKLKRYEQEAQLKNLKLQEINKEYEEGV